MRVNVYSEEMSGRTEIISKEIDGVTFTGLRFYLELPVTMQDGRQVAGPFMHRPGDDDSAAVTFWGKRDLRIELRHALEKLDDYYAQRTEQSAPLECCPYCGGTKGHWEGCRAPNQATGEQVGDTTAKLSIPAPEDR